MTPSVHARLAARPATARAVPRPATMSMISAADHSRSVVTEAGGSSLNSRSAIPAPDCTDTAPASTRAAGSAAGASRRASPAVRPAARTRGQRP